MEVEIEFTDVSATGRTFLTWRPATARIRLVDIPVPAPASVTIQLSSRSLAEGGAIVFSNAWDVAAEDTIELDMPLDGSPREVWVAGKFGSPSKRFGDVLVDAYQIENGQIIGSRLASKALMVRVRKNAQMLSVYERNLFLSAMAAINDEGHGRWTDLRDMHEAPAYEQIHVNYSFLPWHRAYLLHLERELQTEEEEIALPYWKFDEKADKLFQPSFIGRGNNIDNVVFSNTNPLRFWGTSATATGVKRRAGVGPQTVIRERNDFQSLRISEGPNANFEDFCNWFYIQRQPDGLEAGPHNGAHGAHGRGSYISDPTQSQKDPLFYLLHSNVDRLWAKWQWFQGGGTVSSLSDPNSPTSYISGQILKDGHNRNDTMWPWDGFGASNQRPDRPPTAPGGGMPASSMTAAPGPKPKVKDMIDYFGANGGNDLGFAYDDVAFEV